MANKFPPFLKIVGRSKCHHVVVDRFPLHNEQVSAWLLDRTFEPDAVATFGAQKDGHRLTLI